MSTVVAPGRVNIIGDHTDYVGGLALPCAIDLAVTATFEVGARFIDLSSDATAEIALLDLPVGGAAHHLVDGVAAVGARGGRTVARTARRDGPADDNAANRRRVVIVGRVHDRAGVDARLRRGPSRPGVARTSSRATRHGCALRRTRPTRDRAWRGGPRHADRCGRSDRRSCADPGRRRHRGGVERTRAQPRRHALRRASRRGRKGGGRDGWTRGRRRCATRWPYATRSCAVGRRHIISENERVRAVAAAFAHDDAKAAGTALLVEPRQLARRRRRLDPRPRQPGRRAVVSRPRRVRRATHRRRLRRQRGRARRPPTPRLGSQRPSADGWSCRPPEPDKSTRSWWRAVASADGDRAVVVRRRNEVVVTIGVDVTGGDVDARRDVATERLRIRRGERLEERIGSP